MRKIFTDKLPKTNRSDRLCIDWKNSIGYKVNFIYDDINGIVEIVNYEYLYLTLKYLDYEDFRIHISSFVKCQLGVMLKRYTYNYKFEIGEDIIDNKRNLTIINTQRKKDKNGRSHKWYSYTCNKCSYKGWIIEGSLVSGSGCSCCSGKVVVKGINDVATTHPQLVKYFTNSEDAYRYSFGTSKKVKLTCPDCGHKKEMSLNALKHDVLPCPNCSDGISYPEKFMLSLLKQLKLEFIFQLSKSNEKWCGNYKYDFALLKKSCLIEVHGGGHYSDNFSTYKNSKRTFKEELINDINKEKLAIQNDIKHYIVINAKYSNLEWIKKSVLESDLPTLLNFTEDDVDWLECENFACCSLMKDACALKRNNNDLSTTDIGKMLSLDKSTICKYLKIGSKLNLCEYDPILERNKGLLLGRAVKNINGLV